MPDIEVAIHDLRLRAVIGCNPWERELRQDIVVNLRFTYDATRAIQNDDLASAIDYKSITKRVIDFVEGSSYQLVETLVARIYELVYVPEMTLLEVRLDKPHALRFSDNVSVKVASDAT